MRHPRATALAALLTANCASPPPHAPRVLCAQRLLVPGSATEDATIFQGNAVSDGYPVFRIPSLVVTRRGVLVAFAEGRQSLDDPGAGRIVVVAKRSTDCGATWSAPQVVASHGDGDAHNPCAVYVDDGTRHGRLLLFFARRPASAGGEFDLPPGLGADSARVWVSESRDEGSNFGAAREITSDVKAATWSITSPGPGVGIVTRYGTPTAPAGRIVVPGWYAEGAETGSFVFFSDDGGATFTRGLPGALGTDEAQVVERVDGTLLLDARGGTTTGRLVFASDDGGATFGPPVDGLAMAPITSGVIRYSAVRDGDADDVLIHSAIAPDGRYDGRVFVSTDEGVTWGRETVLTPGLTQYTILARLDDGSLGLVYETLGGDADAFGFQVRFLRFGLERLAP